MVPNLKHAIDYYSDRFRRFLLRFQEDEKDWERLRRDKKAAKVELEKAAKMLFDHCHTLLTYEKKWEKYPTVKAALAVKDSAIKGKGVSIKDLKGVFDSRLRAYVIAKTKHREAMNKMNTWVSQWPAFVRELTEDAHKVRSTEDRKEWQAVVKKCGELEHEFDDFLAAVPRGAKSKAPDEKEIEAKYMNQKFGRMDMIIIDTDPF